MISYFLLANLAGDTGLGGYGQGRNRSKRHRNHRHRARGDAKGRPKAFKTGKGGRSVATRPPHPRGAYRPVVDSPHPLRTDEKPTRTLSYRVEGGIRKGGTDGKNDLEAVAGGTYPGRYPHRPTDGGGVKRHNRHNSKPRGDGGSVSGWSRVVGRYPLKSYLFGKVGLGGLGSHNVAPIGGYVRWSPCG